MSKKIQKRDTTTMLLGIGIMAIGAAMVVYGLVQLYAVGRFLYYYFTQTPTL